MSNKITQYRNMDSLGRVVIPRYMRKSANINDNDMLKITYSEYEKTILIQKEERHEYLQKISTELLKRTIAYRHENSGEMSRTYSFFFSFVSFFGFKVFFYIFIT